MANCIITIVTASGCDKQKFVAQADVVDRDGILYLNYLQDRDPVTLEIGNRYLNMHRRGDTEIIACYREGEQTVTELVCGANRGEIPTLTKRCFCRPVPRGYAASLLYDFNLSGNVQTFQLEFYIEISEEK